MPGDTIPIEYMQELFREINAFKEEMIGDIVEDKTYIIESSQINKRHEIASKFKELPYKLYFWGYRRHGQYPDYGYYAEFWSLSDISNALHYDISKKKEALSKKYGLECFHEMPRDEVHFKQGETDILSTHPLGPLLIYLDFPRVTELMKDILERN
jgi:hypothetical protein